MGGADVIRQALRAGHVEELSISIAPVVLGGGKRLFHDFDEPRAPAPAPVTVRDAHHLSRRALSGSGPRWESQSPGRVRWLPSDNWWPAATWNPVLPSWAPRWDPALTGRRASADARSGHVLCRHGRGCCGTRTQRSRRHRVFNYDWHVGVRELESLVGLPLRAFSGTMHG